MGFKESKMASTKEPLYGCFRRNRRREDRLGKKNEDLKIEAKI